MHAVAVVGYDPGVGDCGECRGRTQQECALGTIPHAAKNDGGEVGKGIDTHCAGHEEEGVDPDLPLQEGVHDFLGSDVVIFGVAAVGV